MILRMSQRMVVGEQWGEYCAGRDCASRPAPPRGPALCACFAARTDAGEREEVVRVRREDRIAVEVLRRVEAVEVLGAVRRPAGADEQRDDGQVLQEELLELRRSGLLLLLVER